ncbi:PLDc N-terminal domain-containing protein [Desulfovibrio legallii]|jgi:hypothetical protein|uniref:Phospholipase_D-nuclease N-terminal n=1 Tax=Desulfovibrio legallii TaxID=571438 RepID=A0A1G7K0H5_9BACT|nr:PLDc N-terminal domain-containing protein [Desulfovibrio legallii]SDF30309.1 Phospholipase_D-nuclease N-terminal [Desulfovibrio legallii]
MIFHWWHVLVLMVPMIPSLWSILHIWGHEFASPQQRVLWLLLVVFVPVLGGIIYIFTGRKKALGEVKT